MKWNKEVKKVVMECFADVSRLMKKVNLLGDTAAADPDHLGTGQIVPKSNRN